MTITKTPDAVYDAVTKRYKATCPKCGRIVARAKREAAIHNMAQHIAYDLCPNTEGV